MSRGAVLLALALLSTCKREQTFAEAMEVLCDLPGKMDAGDAVELARLAKLHVTNPEVLTWMSSVTPVPRDQRDSQIREMVKRANIHQCWMLPPENP